MLSLATSIVDENTTPLPANHTGKRSGLSNKPVLGKRRVLHNVTNVTHGRDKKQLSSESTPGPEDSTLKKAKVVVSQPSAAALPAATPTPLQQKLSVRQLLAASCPIDLHQTALEYSNDDVEIMGKSWEVHEPGCMASQEVALFAHLAADHHATLFWDQNLTSRKPAEDIKDEDFGHATLSEPESQLFKAILSEFDFDTQDFLTNIQTPTLMHDFLNLDVDDIEQDVLADPLFSQ